MQRLQSKQEELTEEEEMKQQQRMAVMKDLIKKIRSKGRMDAKNRWWVSELLAKDCEKTLIRTGWEDAMQKWYEWLEHMKKKGEKEKMEEMHQRKVQQMTKSAEGSAGLLHKITKPKMWRGGVQILKKEKEDANLLEQCEATRKEWSKHWQCNEEIQNMQNKPWRNEESKECKESLPRLKEGVLKGIKIVQGKNRSGMRRIPPKSSSGLNKRTRGKLRIFGEGGAEWRMAATSLHNDVPLDSEERHE